MALSTLSNLEILCAAEYLSMDAGLRAHLHLVPPGITMIGGQVAKIIESKNPRFPKNAYVFGHFGWQTHIMINPDYNSNAHIYLLPDLGHRSRSLALGMLGMTG